MNKMETVIVVYEQGGNLYAYNTAEYIRRATIEEQQISNDSGYTGAFNCSIKIRTLKIKCPMLCNRLTTY
jgi:hypothetical protein